MRALFILRKRLIKLKANDFCEYLRNIKFRRSFQMSECELSEFHRILVSLNPAFTIKSNWEFIRFEKKGTSSFLSYKSSLLVCNSYFIIWCFKNSSVSQQTDYKAWSTKHETCPKLNIKTSERLQWHRPDVFVVYFEHNSHLVLALFLLLCTENC